LIEKKISRAISRKFTGRRKPQALRKAKQRKKNRRHSRAIGLHGCAPEAEIPHSRQAEKHGRAMAMPGHTTVRGGTGSHASWHDRADSLPRAVLQFSAIFMFSLFNFRGLLRVFPIAF